MRSSGEGCIEVTIIIYPKIISDEVIDTFPFRLFVFNFGRTTNTTRSKPTISTTITTSKGVIISLPPVDS